MNKPFAFFLLILPTLAIANGYKDYPPVARVYEMPSASSASAPDSFSSLTASASDAQDGDDVADELLAGDDSSRVMVEDYLSSIPEEQRETIRRYINELSEREFAAYLGRLGATRWWGSKKEGDKDKMGAALMALVQQFKAQNAELKRQTEQMQGSSEHAEKVYQFNVRQARVGAITGMLTTAISFIFNILQATNVFADSTTNTTAC